MTSKNLCLIAVCLLLGGCMTIGDTTHQPISGMKLFPTAQRTKSDQQSLIKEVENDSFPRAEECDVRVCVSQ